MIIIKDKQNKRTEFKCVYCNKLFTANCSLKYHISICKIKLKIDEEQKNKQKIKEEKLKNKPIFECMYCKKILSSKQSTINHQLICKNKDKDVPIEINKDIQNNNIVLEQLTQKLIKKIVEKEVENRRSEIISILKNKREKFKSYKSSLSYDIKNKFQKEETNSETKLKNIYEYKFGCDFIVPIRSDGMINATSLCKAGNKLFEDYLEDKNTRDYLDELQSNMDIPLFEKISYDVGGNYSGLWIQRIVGYHLAQWISPIFAVKVYNILDELFITSNVKTGYELDPSILNERYNKQIRTLQLDLNSQKEHNKTLQLDLYTQKDQNETLQLDLDTQKEKNKTLQLDLDTQKEQNKTLQVGLDTQKEQNKTQQLDLDTNKKNYHTLLCKHNSTLKTHRYTKFNDTNPCFYIIDSGIKCECLYNKIHYKFGITGIEHTTIDERLRNHRTLWPLLKVRFILFMKDIIIMEKNFKIMYEKEINPNGHEIIEGVTLDDMISRIKMLLDILVIKEYRIIDKEKLDKYNEYVETTIKVND